MGCSDSRARLSPAEQRFLLGEKELLYSNLESIKVDLVHRKYSNNEKINENQWLNINRNLNLSLNNPHSSFSSNIKSYYDQYKENQLYPLQSLLCLGIVLSQGTITEKARLIFEAFSVNGAKHLPKETVSEIFNTFFDVFVKKAAVLIKDLPNIQVEQLDHELVLKHMKAGKKDLKNYFIRGLLAEGDSVDLKAFIAWASSKDNSFFFDSCGFRKELKRLGRNKTKKKDKALVF